MSIKMGYIFVRSFLVYLFSKKQEKENWDIIKKYTKDIHCKNCHWKSTNPMLFTLTQCPKCGDYHIGYKS